MRTGALTNGSTFFFVGDHLGSTALITDSLGAETSRIRYFPFGGIRSQTIAPNTDKLFTGQQQETDGIYHYGARLYNTDVARFPQADTFSMPTAGSQAISRYSYVQNNPTNFTDPTGHVVAATAGGLVNCEFSCGGGGKGGGAAPPETYLNVVLGWKGSVGSQVREFNCWDIGPHATDRNQPPGKLFIYGGVRCDMEMAFIVCTLRLQKKRAWKVFQNTEFEMTRLVSRDECFLSATVDVGPGTYRTKLKLKIEAPPGHEFAEPCKGQVCAKTLYSRGIKVE